MLRRTFLGTLGALTMPATVALAFRPAKAADPLVALADNWRRTRDRFLAFGPMYDQSDTPENWRRLDTACGEYVEAARELRAAILARSPSRARTEELMLAVAAVAIGRSLFIAIGGDTDGVVEVDAAMLVGARS